jgi:biotin operon repressor
LTSARNPHPDLRTEPLDQAEELSPSSRVLLAIERIASRGPLTYEELRHALGTSKTATWRIVATLKDSGWVRLRHGGRLIELDQRLDEIFATAHFSDREFAALCDVMTGMGDGHEIHFDLFVMNAKGRLALHETTRRLTAAAQTMDMQDEALILAACAAMTPPQLDRYLQAVAETEEPETLRDLQRKIWSVRSGGAPDLFRAGEGRALVLSLRGAMGTPGALRLSPKTGGIRTEALIAACEEIAERARPVVETLGEMTGIMEARTAGP